jgi:TfoX N-terminal domain
MKSEGTRSARECYDAIVERLGREQMGVVAAKMFGMPCVKADGKMFAGFSEEAMVFKLGGEAHAQALGLARAQVFDPSKMGRPMKAWVQVPSAHTDAWEELAERALAYVREKAGG